MSVSSAIIKWLKTFEISADTDVQSATAATYSLAKEPVINKKTYLSGTQVITEHYTLIARLDLSTNTKRIGNVEWSEAIEAWVKSQNDSGSFPEVDGTSSVEITTPMVLSTNRDTKTGLYQLTIAITYTKKGK